MNGLKPDPNIEAKLTLKRIKLIVTRMLIEMGSVFG
jgi:hypothetical protein